MLDQLDIPLNLKVEHADHQQVAALTRRGRQNGLSQNELPMRNR